jgi:membrane protease YdiL (CAAX protease family)
LWALGCAAVAYPIGRVLGQMPPSNHPWRPMQSVLVMLGIFWFVALSEEFFFRALLQQWLTEWSGARTIGLLTTSAIFGLCHLGYRNQFPNWRFAILAAILGLFCGMAYQQSRSMRASMVTHTLVVGAFRLFLA